MAAVDTSSYERQRRSVNDDYAARSSAGAFSRFLSQKRGSRQLGDLNRSFGESVPGFNASFGRRGLSGPGVRSGVQTNALQRYVGNYQRDVGGLQDQIADQDRQYQLQQAQLDQQRQRALADIEAKKSQEIALAALNLKSLAPLIGG